MANHVSFKRCYMLASTLVAFGCIVGVIIMVSTMPHCPPQNCPTPDDQTAQQLPDSASSYGPVPPPLDGTDVVFEDSVTSLTMSDIDDTYRRRDNITQRKPQGKSFPFTRTETSNAVPPQEASVEESPVPNTYTLNITKHSFGTGSAKVSDSVLEILRFLIDLLRAEDGVSDTGTTESFNETKTLTLVIERQVKNVVEPAHNFHTETETLEMVIDKVVTGVASSNVNDPLNAKATFKINIERKLNGLGHSVSIESPGENGISDMDIEKTVNGIGSSNTSKQSTDEPRTFELDIDTVMERIAALDDFEEPDNVNATFKVDIERQRNGLGHSDSIDSPRENGISDMDIEKTVNGIGSSNTSNKQSTDESRNFELDIEKVMEKIAALDDFEESDNVDTTLTVDIEKQRDGLGYSNSTASSGGNEIPGLEIKVRVFGIGSNNQTIDVVQVFEVDTSKVTEGIAAVDGSHEEDNVNVTFKIDIERQSNGLGDSDYIDSPNGNKTFNNQIINETQLYELNIGKVMEGVAAVDVFQDSDNVNATLKVDVERQFNGIGYSDSVGPSSGKDISGADIDKTVNGIGFASIDDQRIDEAHAFELDFSKHVKGIASSDLTDVSGNVNATFVVNIGRQSNGFGSSHSFDSPNGNETYIEKTMNGIGSSRTTNRTPELVVEKTAIGTSSSASRNSSKERPENSKLNLQKQVVGIGSRKLHHSSNQPNNSAYLEKEITGIGSSQRKNKN